MAESVAIALLRHELEDGSWHIDLLMAEPNRPSGDDDRTVACWRCPERPDEAKGRLLIERVADHRGLYLRLEGARELGGGRGLVTSLRRGVATTESGHTLRIQWRDGGSSRWSLRAAGEGGPSWILTPQ